MYLNVNADICISNADISIKVLKISLLKIEISALKGILTSSKIQDMCIFDKLNTYISITIITNIFNQLKISFNEDTCILNQLGHDGSTVAHLEDRTSEPMLPSAPRSLLFQIEIFVKCWSDCHVVKLCPYCLFFFVSFFID